jgi:hypothetical protein
LIKAIHTLIYSDDPEATRSFLREVLRWPYVEHPESEPGWLIFKSGPSELGVHPTSGTHEGEDYSYPRHHSISLMCDDINGTIAQLEAKVRGSPAGFRTTASGSGRPSSYRAQARFCSTSPGTPRRTASELTGRRGRLLTTASSRA